MKLSELNIGEKASIVKIAGHGGFRKRIIEMGFIKGKIVESLLDAPLNDPIKYKVMGYEVSLRKKEAELIEIISEEEAKLLQDEPKPQVDIIDEIRKRALNKRKEITIALVGNPNSGKTTVFNHASGKHEHVGNYSGVTVDSSEGFFEQDGYKFTIIDLPGTYSISAYTPEEQYVRKFIIDNKPDIVINVVDATNIERNLFLTTQLIDMRQQVVIALNMYDEFQKKGDKLDYKTLGQMMGIPFVPVIAKNGFGMIQLFRSVIKRYESTHLIETDGTLIQSITNDQIIDDFHHKVKIEHKHRKKEDLADLEDPKNAIHDSIRYTHIPLHPSIEKSITRLKKCLHQNYTQLLTDYCTRYIAIKLIENDQEMNQIIECERKGDEIFKIRDEEIKKIKTLLKSDPESAIIDAKYGYIAGALKETYTTNTLQPNNTFTSKLDHIVANKVWGYPIFILFVFVMFQSTFVLGAYPMEWIEYGVSAISQLISNTMTDGPLKDLIVDGIIGGVGGVIVFLPNILILYLFISFMEDSGYMARAAFIMDKLMHKMGLHGKSFIPLIMGFGCNIPAIMATRTIENRNSRMITILINPLMSCSARLPVYLLLAGTFFPTHAGWALFTVYAIGVILAIIIARILKRFLFKKEETPFVMELPPYRLPTIKSILNQTWEKGSQYLRKMGTVILLGSIIIWFLGYYPRPNTTAQQDSTNTMENSYIGRIGQHIEPIFKPLGFDWKISVALLSGVAAKEIVVSTLGVLYAVDDAEAHNDTLGKRLQQATWEQNNKPIYTTGTVWAFMIFVLIYFPCLATIVAIKNEAGGWGWAMFSVSYSLVLAWIMAFLTQIII